MEMPVLTKSLVALLPRIQPDSNHYVWAQEFRATIKAESEDLWNIITGKYEPGLDLTPIPVPSDEEAELGASEYWSVRSPSPKQIEEYLDTKVHQPNKEKAEESKRIRKLENLAYFYIQKAVCEEKRWMIAGETRPARCFALLTRQRDDLGVCARVDASCDLLREMKFEGWGVEEARLFISEWFDRLQKVQDADDTLRWPAQQYQFFLVALNRNEHCRAWVEEARFRFGESDQASTMAEVFQSFLAYQYTLDRQNEGCHSPGSTSSGYQDYPI